MGFSGALGDFSGCKVSFRVIKKCFKAFKGFHSAALVADQGASEGVLSFYGGSGGFREVTVRLIGLCRFPSKFQGNQGFFRRDSRHFKAFPKVSRGLEVFKTKVQMGFKSISRHFRKIPEGFTRFQKGFRKFKGVRGVSMVILVAVSYRY